VNIRLGRRLSARDEGATLIIALIIVTVIALVAGALLFQSDSSVRSALALRDQAGAAYNADGAAQVAINDLRLGTGFPAGQAFDNASGTTCFGPNNSSGTRNLQDFYPAINGQNAYARSSASVVCTGEPGTGAQGSLVRITTHNKPKNAILTLGTNSGEDGLNIKNLSSTIPFNVHGTIVSNSNINVVSGTLQSSSTVTAHTGCTGTIVSVPPINKPVDCAKPTVADPGYASLPEQANPGAAVVPTYRSVPSNVAASCPGKLVTFQPGYYDDATALSNLMNGTGPCKDSVWWFKPGTYYFDFHNVENPLLGGNDVWLIKNGQLIAGTPCAARVFPDPVGDPNNPKCTEVSQPAVPATVPGACEFPTENPNPNLGVQFIFGGDSQLQLSGGDAEICSSYQPPPTSGPDRAPIAFYGLQSGTVGNTTQSGLQLSSVTAAGGFSSTGGGTLASKLQTSDGTFGSWKANSNNDSATLSVSGFAPTATIPAGSTFKSAVLHVKHRHSDPSSSDTLTATLTPTGGAAAPVATVVGPTGSSSFTTNDLPIDPAATGSLASAIHAGTFTGASVDLKVALAKKNDVEDIDSITLDISYQPPAYRSESTAIPGGNCLTSTYTGVGSGACAVLSTTNSYAGAFYMQGTTYTPIAPIDVSLNNVTQQVLRYGVISRSLFIKETGSITYAGPVIVLPDDGTGYGSAGTIVDLTVYVCPSVSTNNCANDASKKLLLTSRVLIYDASGVTPPTQKKQISVLSWSEQR
jgi:Tfp pilus assembly protein PilX